MRNISTKYQKSTVETITYQKGEKTVNIERVWRDAYFEVEDDEVVPADCGEEGVTISCYFLESRDCVNEGFDSVDLTEEEEEQIEALLDEEPLDIALEMLGFECADIQYTFYGPIDIE